MKNYIFLLALCLMSINLCAVKNNTKNSDEAPMPKLQPSMPVELPKPVFGPQKPLSAEQRKLNKQLKKVNKDLYRKRKAEKEQNIHPQDVLMPAMLFLPHDQDELTLTPDQDLNTN